VSIRNSRIVLDTNVWIYGLRQDRDYPACSELLEKLRTFQIVIPRQVLVELQVNLSPREYQRFWQLINAYSARAEISWDPAPAERFDRYRRLGCRRGDAAVATLTEHVGAEALVTENREFLRNVPDLPFRVLSSSDFQAEL
jgi:predicted nucleic acid-binding protein